MSLSQFKEKLVKYEPIERKSQIKQFFIGSAFVSIKNYLLQGEGKEEGNCISHSPPFLFIFEVINEIVY